MSISDEELEKELAALKPTEPSKRLESNIQKQLNADEAPSGSLIRLWPLVAVAVAACLALVLILRNDTPEVTNDLAQNGVGEDSATHSSTADPFADYEPVEAEQRLIEAIDDGVVLVIDNEPVRRLRYQFIDSVTMVNQTDGSVFTMEIPREETLFVPVTLL